MVNKNDTIVQLDAGLTGSDLVTTCVIKDAQKELITSGAQSTRATLLSYNASGAVISREIILITNRTGNILTITRAYEPCPQSDAAVTHTQVALGFAADDYIQLGFTAGHIDALEASIATNVTNINNRVTKADYQNQNYISGVTATGNDSYAITLTPAVGAYAALQKFAFTADVGNTGAATLNVNGLGAKTIKKLHDTDLDTGDIEAGSIVEVIYDGTYFQMVSQVAQNPSSVASALKDQSLYPGEDMSAGAGKAAFDENGTTFVLATTVDVIGYSASNTKWSAAIFGNGTAFTTMKLALRKYSSPSADLVVRIETDSAGSPSGTAVTNGTAAVTAASLSTSLADTTVTFAGSVTLTEGQRYWLVLYINGVITNTTNYYGIGTNAAQHTTTRVKKSWNGSSWVAGLPVSDAPGVTYASDSNGTPRGWKITPSQTVTMTGVTVPSGYSTPVTAYIKDAGGSTLATSTDLIGRTFLFPGTVLTSGTTYRVEITPTTTYGYFTYVAPIVGTYVSFVGGSSGGSDHANGASIETLWFNGSPVFSASMPYIVANGVMDKLLSFTSASYDYKVDFYGIITTNTALGSKVPLDLPVKGALSNTQSGMTDRTDMFLSNTAGVISATAGTKRVKVGTAKSATLLSIDKKLLYGFVITTPGNGTAFQNTYGRPVEVVVTGGTVSAISNSKDNSTFMQKASATNNSIILQPGDWGKIAWSGSPTVTIYYID